jgi:hypothetical protein
MQVPDSIKVPAEAFDFSPGPSLIFYGKGKKQQRFIFTNQVLSEFENEKLHRLELELQKLKINPYTTHPEWTRNDLLRYCYGTGWKTRVAVKTLVNYLKWREMTTPSGYLSLFPKVEKLMVKHNQHSGCVYVHGRDMYYRPILVIDFLRFDFKLVTKT